MTAPAPPPVPPTPPAPPPARGWRRFDTLGLRLFVLMWLTLVASHLVAYALVVPLGERWLPQAATGLPPPPGRPPGPPQGHGPGTAMERLAPQNLPPLPSLPPPVLPAAWLWLDYTLRGVVIALGALLGARWLARPMRDLATASRELGAGLARSAPVPRLDTERGTREVRETAAVFNTMASRLQEQFDARGMHLAAVSHDLRTPLTRLRLRLEQAPPALADAAQRDIAEMTEMIDGTLDVLREMREGGAAEVVQLQALLAALVDDLQGAGHAVTLAEEGPALRVRVRPAALRRVLGNLIGNALRYGGQARVALLPHDGGALVTVDDDGPGIPEDQLEAAFRPWVRLAAAHARSGHGLGLAIARELAERDGGQVTLANRPGGGLQARLWLAGA